MASHDAGFRIKISPSLKEDFLVACEEKHVKPSTLMRSYIQQFILDKNGALHILIGAGEAIGEKSSDVKFRLSKEMKDEFLEICDRESLNASQILRKRIATFTKGK